MYLIVVGGNMNKSDYEKKWNMKKRWNIVNQRI